MSQSSRGELLRDRETETGPASRDDCDAPLKHSHAGERYGLRTADVARHDDVEIGVARAAVGAAAGDDESHAEGAIAVA